MGSSQGHVHILLCFSGQKSLGGGGENIKVNVNSELGKETFYFSRADFYSTSVLPCPLHLEVMLRDGHQVSRSAVDDARILICI